ncbi:APC family permease [Cystobacter ferrugineus]|uniref:Amino acid permease n=1 Tax=Cystobacter ferrugineus TaxID=83449 RepID=A0A1L9B1U1_9BACT|nr:APC family permease [Cystobacter ferrugineus]OJH36231.1 amino acid permease [Cystobacter ferrugineus]
MTASNASSSDTRLKRGITGALLYLFILGDVLGAGVYALIGKLAQGVGGMVWLPLLVALGMAMLTAASYAELVTRYPKAGGSAVFAERAFGHPVISFLVGFCMLAAGVTSAAGLSLAFAGDYLGAFIDVPRLPMALVFLTLVAALNARGIKESLGANVVMTVTEISGLLLVVLLGAWVLGRGEGDPGRVWALPEGASAGGAVLGAALIAFYSFVGFETSANLAEEVREVRRVYPRALFGALLTAGAVYVLVALAAVVAVEPERLAASSGPLLEVVEVAGGVPPRLFAGVALIAVANGGLLTMIMASRLTYGMAEQGLLPAVLGRVLPGRRTPWVAILATTLMAMALTATGELADLAETVVLLLLFVFISTNVAVLVLRRKEPAGSGHFRAWTVVPVLAIVCCGVLLTRQAAATWLRAGGLLLLGGVLYLLTRGRRAR